MTAPKKEAEMLLDIAAAKPEGVIVFRGRLLTAARRMERAGLVEVRDVFYLAWQRSDTPEYRVTATDAGRKRAAEKDG